MSNQNNEMMPSSASKGADINAQTEETQETALTLACCGGFLEVTDFLIKAGADIKLGASTPLMEAAREGHLELVHYLISTGADVNATTATGDTALTYACKNGHTDVADLLLQAYAKLGHESEIRRNPLMKAARACHLHTVQFLISKDANVNKQTTNNDHIALILACVGGHIAVVEPPLAHGADPTHKLKDNSTMLIEASKGGHTPVVQLLLDYPNSMLASPPPPPDLSQAVYAGLESSEAPRVPPHGLQAFHSSILLRIPVKNSGESYLSVANAQSEVTTEDATTDHKEDSPQTEDKTPEVIAPNPVLSEEEHIKDAWDDTSSEEEEEEVSEEQNGPKKAQVDTSKTNDQSDSESESESKESSSEESDSEEESYSSSESDGDGKKDEASIMERVSNRIYIRSSHVQDHEAGGITQQIGATMVSEDALKELYKRTEDDIHALVKGLNSKIQCMVVLKRRLLGIPLLDDLLYDTEQGIQNNQEPTACAKAMLNPRHQNTTTEGNAQDIEKWTLELEKTAKEFYTMQQSLTSKIQSMDTLKQQLQIPVWEDLFGDLEQQIQNNQESTVFQRTRQTLKTASKKIIKAFGTLGATVSQKFEEVKQFSTFKYIEEKVGIAYTNVKVTTTGAPK